MTIQERFWAKVDRTEDCWVWMGGKDRAGYGQFAYRVESGPMVWKAHRFAYFLAKGWVPEEKHLDHLCRNRACVNPSHLEPVSSATNTRRAAAAKATERAVRESKALWQKQTNGPWRWPVGQRHFSQACKSEMPREQCGCIECSS
jgi:HNH endonuclease